MVELEKNTAEDISIDSMNTAVTAEPVPVVSDAPAGKPSADEKPAKGSRYYPLSMLEYVGLVMLFSIPFVGWAVLLCLVLGASRNINRTRFARAWLIISIMCGGVLISTGLLAEMLIRNAVDTLISSATSSVISTTAEQTGVELDVIGDSVNSWISQNITSTLTGGEPKQEESEPSESEQTARAE